jgi:hypothetical protein
MIFGPKADGTFRTANFRPVSLTCPSLAAAQRTFIAPEQALAPASDT